MKKQLLPLLFGILFILGSCGTGANQDENDTSRDAVFDSNDYKQIVQPNNELGFKLMGLVDADEHLNIFISPTSLLMALGMVYNGADGETKAEISNALQVEGITVDELNKANASLLGALNKDTDEIKTSVANSIWLNKRFHFQDAFRQNNEAFFQAKIETIDVMDNESAESINEWVKNATNKKITDIIQAPLNPDLVAILINAIYFKGDWKYEFAKELTEEKNFYLDDGTSEPVPFMIMNDKKLRYMENGQFQTVALPYGENEDMSMHIFLPKEAISMDEFRQTLTTENWKSWNDELRQKKGTLMLPKFQLEYEVLLNDALKSLAMNAAFGREADLSKMIEEDEKIWIDTVKQKTFIEVDEEGTEAAAVTSAEVVMESITNDEPFHMDVNRPFFIAIQDNKTDAILFMGEIAYPEQRKE
ncbi:serpin family protein [Virgibacillus sp. W0181]|uniref:serpin family protein n=1 Tax=Virgibacillus sp. W0181 TaxID=3391581 RepID=UPI003F47C5B0